MDSLNVFDFDDEIDLEKVTDCLAERGLFSSKKIIFFCLRVIIFVLNILSIPYGN